MNDTGIFARNIVKHNTLVESHYKMTVRCQKLVLLFISLVNSRDENPGKFQVSIRTCYEVLQLDVNKNARSELLNSLQKLSGCPIRMKDNKGLIFWFASVELLDNGMIEFEFGNKLIKYLTQLRSNFTQFRLGYPIQFKKSYSIRLYEICKKNEFARSKTYEMDNFRAMIGCDGKYLKYKDLNKRVIMPAKRELDEKADISFNYVPLKIDGGRGYSHIKFIFYSPRDPNGLDEIKLNKEPEKLPIVIPNERKNSDNFNRVFRNYHENKNNFPKGYTFEIYLQENNFNIIDLAGGGYDLEYRKKQLNFFK